MKKIKYISIYFLLLLLFSCSEDAGNYNYKELDFVTEIDLDKSYSVYMNDEIRIEPKIHFEDPQTDPDSDKFTHLWQLVTHKDGENSSLLLFDTLTLSTERILEFTPTPTPEITYGKWQLYYTVTVAETGLQRRKLLDLTVKNKYNYGVFLLHKKGDHSEICLINDNNEIVSNIYDKITGQQLMGEPKFMVTYRSKTKMNLYTDDQETLGKIFDFNKFIVEANNIQSFFEKPEFYVDVQKVHSDGDNIFMLVNNKCFSTSLMVPGDVKPYFAYEFPLFDEDIHFMQALNDYGNSIFQTVSGKVYKSDYQGPTQIKGVNIPGKVLFAYEKVDSPGDYIIRLIALEGDVVKEHELKTLETGGWNHTFATLDVDGINENTLFANSLTQNISYFHVENKIYKYDYHVGSVPVLFYEFPAGTEITCVDMIGARKDGVWNDSELRVAINKGDSGTSASLYFIDLNGDITKSYQNICGRIADIIKK